MDLQGRAAHFPDPGDIFVDATKLTDEEKALILYRHARARSLEAVLRQIVRFNAKTVVKNSHFTPERIRRLLRICCQRSLQDGQKRRLPWEKKLTNPFGTRPNG